MKNKCMHCGEDFLVTAEDQQFYLRVDVPVPSLCYFCRMLRRLSHRNERHLYHRKCDHTGKQIISAYSVNKAFPVFDIAAWWGDGWDAKEFGCDFDFSRPFFEQFQGLREKVPRLSLQQQQPMENSAYCNCASKNKNCYLTFSTNSCEDCYYGSWVNLSKDCIDCLNINSCELCYECVGCRECYNLRYSQDCINCRDSFFLRDCVGCTDCFGCVSLVRERYCLFNEKVGRESYKEFISSFQSASYAAVEEKRCEIERAIGVVDVKEYHGDSVENCAGEYIRNCRDAYYAFECDSCEDIRYAMCVQQTKSSMDYCYYGVNAELMYECQACGFDVFSLRFCNLCWSGCSNLSYCDHMFASADCFGCVGLKRAKHCIFNKQYSEKDYHALSEKIISHMKETGEWGEFFPTEMSAFAYNETLANEHLPLNREQVEELGWAWQEDNEEKKSSYLGPELELPDKTSDVDQSICDRILRCAQSARPYKIIKPEYQYYQKLQIPLPRLCPDARHIRRLTLRNPRILWKRECYTCAKEIQTAYAPVRPERVHCETCYQKIVFE